MIAKLLKNTILSSALAFSIGFISCGDQASKDDTASTGSKTESTPNADTATTANSTPVKKKGKVSAKMEATPKGEYKKDSKGVYTSVEVQPVYPGGETALSDFIANTLEYPTEAIDRSKEGTVRVEFVVDEKGKVTSATTAGAQLGDGLDQAAIAVINKMPVWTPGMVNGKPVKTRLVLPVTYRLE